MAGGVFLNGPSTTRERPRLTFPFGKRRYVEDHTPSVNTSRRDKAPRQAKLQGGGTCIQASVGVSLVKFTAFPGELVRHLL